MDNKRKKWVIFNVLYVIISFFISIVQGCFSTIVVDENGNISFDALLRDYRFWIIFVVWIFVNLIFMYEDITDEEKCERRIIRRWVRQKNRFINDVRKKVKQGNYAGAKESIEIMKELEDIMEGKNDK